MRLASSAAPASESLTGALSLFMPSYRDQLPTNLVLCEHNIESELVPEGPEREAVREYENRVWKEFPLRFVTSEVDRAIMSRQQSPRRTAAAQRPGRRADHPQSAGYGGGSGAHQPQRCASQTGQRHADQDSRVLRLGHPRGELEQYLRSVREGTARSPRMNYRQLSSRA